MCKFVHNKLRIFEVQENPLSPSSLRRRFNGWASECKMHSRKVSANICMPAKTIIPQKCSPDKKIWSEKSYQIFHSMKKLFVDTTETRWGLSRRIIWSKCQKTVKVFLQLWFVLGIIPGMVVSQVIVRLGIGYARFGFVELSWIWVKKEGTQIIGLSPKRSLLGHWVFNFYVFVQFMHPLFSTWSFTIHSTFTSDLLVFSN